MERFTIETKASDSENVSEAEKPKYVFSANEVTRAIDFNDAKKMILPFAILTEAIKTEAQNEDLYRVFVYMEEK